MTDRRWDVFNLSDGLDKAYAFVDDDNSAVMVKIVAEPHGDPVELEPSAARQLACALLIFADRVDGEDRDWRQHWESRAGDR